MSRDDDSPGGTGQSSRRNGNAAALHWVALVAVGLFWATTVLGIAIALADKGVAAWWVVLIFGALPLMGLYRIAERLTHRQPGASREQADAVTQPGPPEAGLGKRSVPAPSSVPDEPIASTHSPSPEEPVVVDDLTNREREVLALLDKGRTNGEIARELYVSTGTVKSHVNSIFRKLGARNRTEAVAHARRLNLIS